MSEIQSPVSNTGSNSLSIRPDYLQVVTCHATKDDWVRMVRHLAKHFQDEVDFSFERPMFRGVSWFGSGRSVRGIQVAIREDGDRYRGWVLIPGQCWKFEHMYSIGRILTDLRYNWDARATRIDIALDDFTKRLDLKRIEAAASAGQFSGSSVWSIHKSQKRNSSEVGCSIVFGSPQSDKRVTFYDKEVESKGEIKSIRMEARLRDDLADFIFQLLVRLYPDDSQDYLVESQQMMLDYLFSMVSFIDRVSKNLSRCPRLDWWQDFIDFCGVSLPKKIPSLRPRPSFQRSVDWLFRQVSSSLAVFRKVFGADALMSLIEFGENHMSSWHDSLIKVYCHDL